MSRYPWKDGYDEGWHDGLSMGLSLALAMFVLLGLPLTYLIVTR